MKKVSWHKKRLIVFKYQHDLLNLEVTMIISQNMVLLTWCRRFFMACDGSIFQDSLLICLN